MIQHLRLLQINFIYLFIYLLLALPSSVLFAGSLNSPAAISSTDSAMVNLEDIYNRLDSGKTESALTAAFTEPTLGPAATGHNLNEIISKAPLMDETLGASPANVLAGKTYWGINTDNWGTQTGTMQNNGAQNITPLSSDISITQGYHDGAGKVAGDSDLVSANIKAGITLFNVTGKTEVVDTTTGNALAGEILSGKKAWVDGVEVTGNLSTQTLTNANDTLTAGNYSTTTLSAIDTDLNTANIKAGITIFGILGKKEVVDTTSGTALSGEILSGKKAWIDGVEITGSLSTQTLSNVNDTVTAGNYTATTLSAIDTDLVTANVRAGVTIFGVAGKTEVVDTTTGDALAGEILSGKKAWVDGVEVTGSLASQTLSDSNDTLTAGNYAGTTLSAVDSDLISDNIKSGKTIFGILGKMEVVDSSTGDAVAADILSGKKAWVDGLEVTGIITNQSLSDANSTVAPGIYASTNLATVDADLISANIKAGITIFGVPGKAEVVDTTGGGTATAADVCSGKTFWLNGILTAGTKTGC